MGTDTAFALGVLALVGRRSPPRLRVFLLTLVIVDDIAALTIIALVYTDDVSVFGACCSPSRSSGSSRVDAPSGVRNGVAYFIVGHRAVGGACSSRACTRRSPVSHSACWRPRTRRPRHDLQERGALWRLFREQPTPEYARSASASVAARRCHRTSGSSTCSTRGRAT